MLRYEIKGVFWSNIYAFWGPQPRPPRLNDPERRTKLFILSITKPTLRYAPNACTDYIQCTGL